jgi:hypothetical protein
MALTDGQPAEDSTAAIAEGADNGRAMRPAGGTVEYDPLAGRRLVEISQRSKP